MTLHTPTRRQLLIASAAILAVPVASRTVPAYAQASAQESTPGGDPLDEFESLVTWLTGRMDDLGVPGAAVGLTLGTQRHTRGLGIADANTGTEFTPDTPFGIASLTKIFTATALATLASEGALSLDDPLQKHLPDFRVADPEATASVTIGHLLSHAGGWADLLEPVPGQDSLAWYAAHMTDMPQVVPVDTHFSYSNSAFLLAGAVIEQVTGQPYEDVIATTILNPLGMTHSGFPGAHEFPPNRAVGHQTIDGEVTLIPPEEPPRAVNPAAGLISSIDDMLTFLQAHAGIDTGSLDPVALASMPQERIAGGSLGPIVVDHIGTGWMLLNIGGEQVLMSQGGDAGLISAMVAVPARQFGMVVLTNSEAGLLLANETVMRGVSDFLSLSLPDPAPHQLAPGEALAATGQFALPGWLTFTTSAADGKCQLTTTAGDQVIPELTGEIVMTSPTLGYLTHPGGRLWIDLVPDDTGTIQWLRFAARLVPRIG